MPAADRSRPVRRDPGRAARVAGAGAAALAALTLLAGCGSDDAPAAATPVVSEVPGVVEDGVHNRQDVAFVTDMVTRHRQAIALAGLAQERAGDDAVRALAKRVKDAETPELAQLTRWLAGWGEPAPTGSGATAAAELAALTAAKGEDFDKRFLTAMVAHHEGAVLQARDQLKNGADERVKGLADDIVNAQTSELTELRALLG